jgi:hypothetical protein
MDPVKNKIILPLSLFIRVSLTKQLKKYYANFEELQPIFDSTAKHPMRHFGMPPKIDFCTKLDST